MTASGRLAALLVLAPVLSAAVDRGGFDLTAPSVAYSVERGHGFDLGTRQEAGGPFYYSVRVPEGTWRVRVKLGHAARPGHTTIKAESRRLLVEGVSTLPGQFVERSFVVHVRTPALPPPPANAPGGTAVRLNDREQGALHWDEKLTLEFNGSAPAVAGLAVEPAGEVLTLHLAGDSTVADQPVEPTASWGQMLPALVGPEVAVANHAESGETLKSFLTGLRLDKLLTGVRPGDGVLIQFGHNDSKRQWPQTFAEADTTFAAYLRAYVAEVRRRGAIPVLVTPVHRRSFGPDGRIVSTHGGYPDAVRRVAAETGVPLVDLTTASARLYEALGPERAPAAFTAEGRDATHHNNYGAYQLARAVVAGLVAAVPEWAPQVPAKYHSFDPGMPDNPDAFKLPASAGQTALLPRGD